MFLLPEILLLLLALLILGLDLILSRERHGILGWLTAAGLAGIIASALFPVAGSIGSPVPINTLTADAVAVFFRILLLFGAMITALLSIDSEGVGRRGEYYALMLFSTLGMVWMVSASDLVMLALAIETTSVPLYVLAGFLKRDSRSTEAGLKYFLFGAIASAVMIYGFSLLYGLSGQTDLRAMAIALSTGGNVPLPLVLVAALLVLVGLACKVSAVPFHFWAPDVYEGAPTPVTAFLSTASKAAAFVVLARFALQVFPLPATPFTGALLAVMAVATMTIGNLAALAQKNIKRLLAYSSIAHAGYALIGLAAGSWYGAAATVFYLLAYTVTNLAAFGVVIVVSRVVCTDEVAGFAGLHRRSPGTALIALIAFLSLAGMPPLAGFIAKVMVFAAAVQAGLVWLAAVGVLNSVVGLFYYLTVLKVIYLYRSENESAPIPISPAAILALGIAAVAILVLGVVVSPWFDASLQAARAIFAG